MEESELSEMILQDQRLILYRCVNIFYFMKNTALLIYNLLMSIFGVIVRP